MQAVVRSELPLALAIYLNQNQTNLVQRLAENQDNVEVNWRNVSRTSQFSEIRTQLNAMAGFRKRCMYCVDSDGSDIEHFRPKSVYKDHVFVWANLLLCCAPCGRFKGKQFPLDKANQPLLIDPSLDDPWKYMDFDTETGNLDARYDLETSAYSVKGLETVRILKLNAREHLSNGYKTTYKRLTKIVNELSGTEGLIQKLIQADDHGLLGWCFSPTGMKEAPFNLLTQAHMQEWKQHRNNLHPP